MFHLCPEVSQHLYHRFVHSVDPLIRILHKPTFERQLALFHRQGPNSTLGLNKGFEAMIFSIYFAAITSMTPDSVLSLFGVDQKTMQGRYMIAVEQSLSNARFFQSEELMPLQAGVLFNVRKFSACVYRLSPVETIKILTIFLGIVMFAWWERYSDILDACWNDHPDRTEYWPSQRWFSLRDDPLRDRNAAADLV